MIDSLNPSEALSFRDRDGWGAEGEWNSEPLDKVVWIDTATGFDCMIHRNYSGAWCGYVGVTADHDYFGVDYDRLHWHTEGDHGGLTFTGACGPRREDGSGICHLPLEGRPDKVWWLGFDCNHCQDLSPQEAGRDDPMPWTEDAVYRPLPYVIGCVQKLAASLLGPDLREPDEERSYTDEEE